MTARPLISFKWRWLIRWWIGQAIVLYFFWMLLVAENWAGLVAALTEAPPRDALGPLAVGIISVTALQFGALAPLRPPSRPPSRGESPAGRMAHLPRLARHSASGLAIGAMVGLACWLPLNFLIDKTIGSLRPDPFVEVALWTPGIVAAVVATIWLWWHGWRTPLWLSALTAAFLIATLIVALGLAIFGVVAEYWSVTSEFIVLAIVLGLLPGWAAGTPLTLAFLKRGPPETQLQRLSSRILLGTVIEAVAVIPLDVMVRRKTGCYCAAGTYWALTLMGGVAACALGPVVLLAPMGRRRRRMREGRCEACGYDLRGAPGELCPECGASGRGGQ